MNQSNLPPAISQGARGRTNATTRTCTLRISHVPVARVSERFLSVNVDIAQVVGGRFWSADARRDLVPGGSAVVPPYVFTRPRLARLLREFAPAYLRIGGTASDQVYYDLSDAPRVSAPAPDKYVLTRAQWDALNRFALACGLQVAFTLNAGAAPRDAQRAWRGDNARTLIEYTSARDYPVAMWALGNEPNFFPFAHRLPIWSRQLAHDYATLKPLLRDLAPAAKLAGPASPYWQPVGELLPFLSGFVQRAGTWLDIVTWHYYPQQSRRAPLASRRAAPDHALEPRFLDGFARCAASVERARHRFAPHAEIWLEETGNAQCGGEPGLSDRFIAGFWWLDELGQAARRGHRVVMRQNISGADYGLLDDATLEPNPDYWNSLLWRRQMGTTVFDARALNRCDDLRVYAHSAREGAPGAVTVLVLNLDRARGARVRFDGVADAPLELYLVTGSDLLGKEVWVNGRRLVTDADGAPAIPPPSVTRAPIELPPTSYAFIVLPTGG